MLIRAKVEGLPQLRILIAVDKYSRIHVHLRLDQLHRVVVLRQQPPQQPLKHLLLALLKPYNMLEHLVLSGEQTVNLKLEIGGMVLIPDGGSSVMISKIWPVKTYQKLKLHLRGRKLVTMPPQHVTSMRIAMKHNLAQPHQLTIQVR